MNSPTREQQAYMLGTTGSEHARLARQGRLISRITRHFLEDVGLHSGMRVLDVGCGVGDVALMAARMVAPDGEVIGIDVDQSAIETAEQRASAEKLTNVRFEPCNFADYPSEELFDAVIGRCLLLHQHEPAAALASIARHVMPGGIVAFQEPWFSRGFSFPRMPLFEEVLGWLHNSVRASSLDGDIGLRLAAIFASVGLPDPKLSFEMLVDCSANPELWQYVADTVRSLLPRLEQLGIVEPHKFELDTLADRLRKEQATLGSVVGIMPLMGAWSRKVES